jgi:hypothetical protein
MKFDSRYSPERGIVNGDFIYFAGYASDPDNPYFGRTFIGSDVIGHEHISTLSEAMETIPSDEYEIVDYSSSSNASVSISVSIDSSTSITEITGTTLTYTQPPYISDVVYKLTSYTDNSLLGGDTSSIPIPLTCSVSGASTITYSIVADGVNSIPSWVTLDHVNQQIDVVAPNIPVATTYTFKIRASISGSDYDRLVTLDVSPNPALLASSTTAGDTSGPGSEGKTTK